MTSYYFLKVYNVIMPEYKSILTENLNFMHHYEFLSDEFIVTWGSHDVMRR